MRLNTKFHFYEEKLRICKEKLKKKVSGLEAIINSIIHLLMDGSFKINYNWNKLLNI
jgi:hypothetical protein